MHKAHIVLHNISTWLSPILINIAHAYRALNDSSTVQCNLYYGFICIQTGVRVFVWWSVSKHADRQLAGSVLYVRATAEKVSRSVILWDRVGSTDQRIHQAERTGWTWHANPSAPGQQQKPAMHRESRACAGIGQPNGEKYDNIRKLAATTF